MEKYDNFPILTSMMRPSGLKGSKMKEKIGGKLNFVKNI